jgi:hypothetical protein
MIEQRLNNNNSKKAVRLRPFDILLYFTSLEIPNPERPNLDWTEPKMTIPRMNPS